MIRQQDVDFIEHLHVEPFTYAGSGQIKAVETRTEDALSYILRYEVRPDFILVYSVPSGILK